MSHYQSGPTQNNSYHRVPAQNTAFSVHFIVKGSSKRRHLAYQKAMELQREMGVIPKLKSVK